MRRWRGDRTITCRGRVCPSLARDWSLSSWEAAFWFSSCFRELRSWCCSGLESAAAAQYFCGQGIEAADSIPSRRLRGTSRFAQLSCHFIRAFLRQQLDS